MESKTIREAISGNTEALSQLINSYKDIAYNLALSIAKNKEDAKDITQDSLLKVLENIERFRNESKFSTWLYKIVYNQSIKHVKSHKTRTYIDIDSLANFKDPNAIDSNDELYNSLYKAIDNLEDPERNIIILFYLADKSIKQINIITGLSISNIKVILHRARKKLYKNLEYEEAG